MFARSAGGLASCGDCMSTSACPRPCGESTTRKKLASATNGPSGFSFSEMPGFSPDQSTVPGKLIGSAIVALLRMKSRLADAWPFANSLPTGWGVLRQPREDFLVPVFTVLGLQDPVPLIREVEEPARYALTLQRAKEFVPLPDRAAEIEVVLDQEHRRLELAEVAGPL